MKVHFPDERPETGAIARAVEGELNRWRPARPPDFDAVVARAGERRRRRLLVGGGAAAVAVVGAGAVAALGALPYLAGGLTTIRERLLP